MSQPTLTWSLSWNQYNIAQKLSGNTFTDPDGHLVDCTYVDLTYHSSVNFTKFIATAVKDGKEYGFINDVLVDIQGPNPTGVQLNTRVNGTALTNYSFRIYSSSFLDGDGSYRIGLYVQQADGTWNYEYFFLTTESDGSHLNFELSTGDYLQVPVITN